MTQPTRRVYKFGDFWAAPTDRVLFRNHELIPLTPKVFDTLLLLIENAGHLVEKETFMRRLWPDTFVGDDALAQNISVLRKSLVDGDDAREWIATVPRRGYRFIGVVREELQSAQQTVSEISPNQSGDSSLETLRQLPKTKESGDTESPQAELPSGKLSLLRIRLGRATFTGAVILTGVLAGFLTYSLLAPPSAPRVIRTTQITHSGKIDPWGGIVIDGSRLYFLEREGDHWNLAQTSVNGGDSQVVPAPFRNTRLLALAPDRTEFLIGQFSVKGTRMNLWIWPVQGGPPARVGETEAYDAIWTPDGKQIVYAGDGGVYIVERDGSNSHKITDTTQVPGMFAWSPNGKYLRFTEFFGTSKGSAIWEVNPDGTEPHKILSSWNSSPRECCGSWAPDGRFFYFLSNRAGAGDAWVVREQPGILASHGAVPFRLTVGPGDLGPPHPSLDGRKLYTVKADLKTEVVRYDPRNRAFSPDAFGINVYSLYSYSSDGQWLAYGSDGLRRMRRDGSERFLLRRPEGPTSALAWSPDSKFIATATQTSNCENKLYLMSRDGGSPKELFPDQCEQFDPAWSPDGKFLSFAQIDTSTAATAQTSSIQLLDLSTNQVSPLPGAQGMRCPSWSPDGHFVAAVTENGRSLMLFDRRTSRWTEGAKGTFLTGQLKWSPDSKYLYFQDLLAENQPVYRLRMSDIKREVVVNFEAYIRSGVPRCGFLDLAPDGSIVASLLRNHADIYALALDLP